MKISEHGMSLIRSHEQLRLWPYRCPAGVLTVGYGSTREVRDGVRITQREAEDRLREDVASAEAAVQDVQMSLNQNQFDALVSLVFNIGSGAFRESTLLRKLNAGDKTAAAAEFGRWIYAKKKRLPGLVRRRAEEQALFESGE